MLKSFKAQDNVIVAAIGRLPRSPYQIELIYKQVAYGAKRL